MSERASPPRMAIIGAGLTGTLLAVHILRNAKAPLSVLLVEKRGAFGRGVAYSTASASHVLNVRVANMSAFPDDPNHFLKWLWRHDDLDAQSTSIPPSGHAFVPRGVYGRYVEEQLDDAMREAIPGVVCERRAAEAIDVRPSAEQFEIVLASGERLRVGKVALCLGHFPPRLPFEVSCAELPAERIVNDPWGGDALAKVPAGATVLVLGTGLTMVDVVLSLLDRRHSGPIIALSRRGLLPTCHAQARAYPDFLAGRPLPRRIREALRLVRNEVGKARTAGYDWRGVIDALRPHLQVLWQGFDRDERRRFLRHLRPYWEVHRHRMAPQVARRLEAALRTGQLTVRAGRITSVSFRSDRLISAYSRRGSGAARSIQADMLINCAGPECDFMRVADPLVRSLRARGLIRPDPLGLGIETNAHGEVIACNERPVPGLLALGPIARGALWEMTAVPELRSLCAVVGRRLAEAEMGPDDRRGFRASQG